MSPRTVGLVRYGYRRLRDLADGATAETEFGRDVWRAAALGLDGTSRPRRILFGGGVQPWLRAAVQRWARFRLGAGCTFSTVEVDVRAARWLSRFRTEVHPAVTAAGLTRAVLEQYLSWLLGPGVAGTSKCNYLVVCAAFSTPATDTAGCGGAVPAAASGARRPLGLTTYGEGDSAAPHQIIRLW